MRDIIGPVYIAFALLFAGLFLASFLRPYSPNPANALSLRLPSVGTFLAAMACLCIAFVPVLGASARMLATTFLLGSYAALFLWVRSWNQKIHLTLVTWTFIAILSANVFNAALLVFEAPLAVRVLYQFLLGASLLLLVFRELRRIPTKLGAIQLQVIRWSLAAMIGLIASWCWVVYAQQTFGGVIIFRSNFSEPWLAFVFRLFLTVFLIMAYVGALAYSVEYLNDKRIKTVIRLKHAESENQLLVKTLKEKDDFLRTVSFSVRSQNLPAIMGSLTHEINQPLGAIRLNADFLLAEIDNMAKDEQAHLLSQLVQGSEAISHVLKSFRRFFEVSSEHQAIDVNDLLSDVLRGWQAVFSHKSVLIDFEPQAPLYVFGDRLQLESALTIVVERLLDWMDHSNTRLQIDCSAAVDGVVVQVLMDGLGRKAEFIQMFESATQGGVSSFNSGLWLSRAIVEHHGGALGVCEVTEGLGICLQLPRMKDAK